MRAVLVLATGAIFANVTIASAPRMPAPAPQPAVGESSASSVWFWPLADVLVPGAGLFHNKRYILAGTVAFVRVGTIAAAIEYRNRSREYRSAERAAQVADLVYGPGLRYKDPYSGDYLTSEEFGRRADRRRYVSGLALTIHLGLALWSGAYTYMLESEKALDRTPILDMVPEEQSGPSAQSGASANLRWVFGLRWATDWQSQ